MVLPVTDSPFKRTIFIFSLFFCFVAGAQTSSVVPHKKEFFPLNVGNKYIYATLGGWKDKKVLRYDTLEIVSERDTLGYKMYRFNNCTEYFVKDNTVYTADWDWNGFVPNKLFYPIDSETVNAKPLKSIVVLGKTYNNCYEYTSYGYLSTTVCTVAHGIGLVEIVVNGKKRVLHSCELK